MSDISSPDRRLRVRLALARAALFWEQLWPACWPALCVLLSFVALALFDVLPLLPGTVHAFILALLAIGFGGAVVWAVRNVAWPDQEAARRRIERASGLSHRPLQALADRPSVELDAFAARLWEAHRRRMAAMVRRLRVGWPMAGLAAHDPWGIRSVLAIVLLLGAIDAGAEWPDRLTRALLPVFDNGPPPPATSFDAWVTPPDYTGLPPRFLRAGETGTIRAPTGSILLAQVHGIGAAPVLTIDRANHRFATIDKENFRAQAKLTEGRLVTVSQDGVTLGRWPIEIIPDNPPTIAFARPPQGTPRAALQIDYQATDDYGVERAQAIINRPRTAPGNGSGRQIAVDLPLPGLHLREAKATSYHDLSADPWAGLPVEIHLVATDALGQKGVSATVRMVLPERVFHNPVARAIVEQRKELVRDPTSREAVAEILGDLSGQTAFYNNDAVVFLALRVAQQQLREQHDAASAAAVEKLLWDTALRIEDGGLSLAERDLRRVQEKLQEAFARNAPDAEIDRLMGELKQALDRYMRALAQDVQRHPGQEMAMPPGARTLTSRDLQRMLDRAHELARNGDREQARQLLSQLENMLENLRLAQPNTMAQREANQTEQMMRGLRDMMRQQQKLLDRSFQAQQAEQGAMSKPGGEQPNAAPSQLPGQLPDQSPGRSIKMGPEAGQQEALRHMLGEMMRQLGEGSGGTIPDAFGRAERAMKDAVGALHHDQPGGAVGPQGEALDQLHEGARQLAQRLQQALGRGQPGGMGLGGAGREPGSSTGRDPLGRPTSGEGSYDEGDVKIPDADAMQQSRRILDELRRRAGEPDRPRLELDYIDRLLQRF